MQHQGNLIDAFLNKVFALFILLHSPENLYQTILCYQKLNDIKTSQNSSNSLKYCFRRFLKYPYSEVSAL